MDAGRLIAATAPGFALVDRLARRIGHHRRPAVSVLATPGTPASALNASPGARAYYDRIRARGTGHHAALRQLGNRLVGILHGCLKTHTTYSEETAWPRNVTLDTAA